MHQAVPELQPSEICVTEKYVYEATVSGVKQTNLKEQSGIIEVTVPYDRHTHLQYQRSNAGTISASEYTWLNTEIGRLHIKNYGSSNLNLQPELIWGEDVLPICPRLSLSELQAANVNELNRFDLRLTYGYQPVEPETAPLRVAVHILDEDYIGQQSEETVEQILVNEIRKQSGLKRSLVMRFRIILALPDYLSSRLENELRVSRMMLAWPLATPHRLASLRVGSTFQALPAFYDPQQEQIEWSNLPLKLRSREDTSNLCTFTTDLIRLEISEPAQIYRQSKISGSVLVEFSGLFSGLQLEYQSAKDIAKDTSVTLRTVLVNEFTLSLIEGLKRKYFSPKQHLQFPSVVLDDLRLADIIMLLEDKGFELKSFKQIPTQSSNDLDATEEVSTTKHVIEAVRSEGTRDLTIYMLIQGTDSQTTRERTILGEEKYTTPLSTGSTVIYIRGQLQGDRKRVVSIVNEIQKQLKEQFRHVGTVE